MRWRLSALEFATFEAWFRLKLADGADWFAVESVVEEKVVRDIVPPLRTAGATGIIELPLNKVIF